MAVVLVASCENQTAITPPAGSESSGGQFSWTEVAGSINGEDVYRYEYDYYFNTYFNEYLGNYYESMLLYQNVDLLDEESAREFLGSLEEFAWNSVVQAALIRQMASKEYDISLEPSYYEKLLLPDTVLTINTNRLYALIIPLIKEEAIVAKGVDDAEAQEYYQNDPTAWDCRRVAHIIVTAQQLIDEATEKGQELSEEEAKALAEERVIDIIAQLKAGGDFAELAAQYSADGTAELGGEMDLYFNINGFGVGEEGGFDPLFAEGAFLLNNVGDFSTEPVESSYGYHVIKLSDKKEGFEAVKTYVLNSMQLVDDSEVNEFFSNKLQSMEAAAIVERNFEYTYYTAPEEVESEEGVEDIEGVEDQSEVDQK
jgi:parvulin-like peptidyl-prolyl isomerase